MRKIKKYFKWLTFLSAPLLATTSLLALTSCSSEESNSSSSNSGSNSNNNQATNNSNKEIPEGKVLLSDLVNDKKINFPNHMGKEAQFLSLIGDDLYINYMYNENNNNYKYENVAWQYTNGTPIEYKVTIKVEDGYSCWTGTPINGRWDYMYSDNINGFEYNFSVLRNKNTKNLEYKNLENTNLINIGYNYLYLLPLENQAIIFDERSNTCNLLALMFEDRYMYFTICTIDANKVPNNFGIENFPLFSEDINGQRYFRVAEINEYISWKPSFINFKNLKGSINIEI